LKKIPRKLPLVLGRPGGFLRSLRNYSRTAQKLLIESRLLPVAHLLLHALTGSCSWDLTGWAPLLSAPLSSEITGSPRHQLPERTIPWQTFEYGVYSNIWI